MSNTSQISEWSNQYGIKTVAGTNNVYPVEYIKHIFGKELSSNAIKVLESINQCSPPESMRSALLRKTAEMTEISNAEFIKTYSHFLKALDYINDPWVIVKDGNKIIKTQIITNTSEYTGTVYEKFYVKPTPDEALEKLNDYFKEDRTSAELQTWLSTHSTMCSILEEQWVIIAQFTTDRSVMFRNIKRLSDVQATQPLFPLRSSGKIWHLDLTVDTDIAWELI